MISETIAIAWHNGKLVEREQAAPSIASHSLHLGIGVFDGMMAYWNDDHYYIHRLEAHLDRMRNGSTKMGLKFSLSNQDLESGLLSLLDAVPPNNYYIRPIVYRPGPQLTITDWRKMPVDVTILAVTVDRDVDKPLRCHISPYERVSGRAIYPHCVEDLRNVCQHLFKSARRRSGWLRRCDSARYRRANY